MFIRESQGISNEVSRITNASVTLKELSRQRLNNDVDRFLAAGGSIEQISTLTHPSKVIAKAWDRGVEDNVVTVKSEVF